MPTEEKTLVNKQADVAQAGEKKKSNTVVIVILVIIALCCLCCVGGYVFVRIGGAASNTFLDQYTKDTPFQGMMQESMEKAIENELNKDSSGNKVDFNLNGDGQLPSGFPTDVSIYPGAKIITSVTIPSADKTSYTTTMQVKNTAESEVTTWYKTEMQANGWILDTQVSSTLKALFFTKGENSVAIFLNTDEQKKEVLVNIGADVAK